MMKTPKANNPFALRWNSIQLENHAAARWSAGAFSVYAQRIDDDWVLAPSNNPEAPTKGVKIERVQTLPLHLKWKRWALEPADKEIRFWPAFPDRPLVIKTRMPVILPTNATVTFSIGLPLCLEATIPRETAHLELDRYQPHELSSTWYGDHFEGELCYSVGSRARRTGESPESQYAANDDPLRALCHLTIKNDSHEPLLLEKIRIHTKHLAIYSQQEQLHTNAVKVTFHGENVASTVRYDAGSKQSTSEYQLVREASSPQRHGSILDSLLFKPFRSH